MPDATPTPAPVAPAPTTASIWARVRLWLIWIVLAFATYALVISRLPMPVWLQPWLAILLLLPFLAIIQQTWPNYSKEAVKLLLTVWVIGGLMISIPLFNLGTANFIAGQDTFAGQSYNRAVHDFWLKFSGWVNPDMLRSRQVLAYTLQQAQDEYGNNLIGKIAAIRDPEERMKVINEEAKKLDALKTQNQETIERFRNSVSPKRSTGPFGLPYVIWVIAIAYAISTAVGMIHNVWVKFAIGLLGGLLFMYYLGGALPEITGFFSGSSSFSPADLSTSDLVFVTVLASIGYLVYRR